MAQATKRKSAAADEKSLGEICRDRVYPLPVFRRLAGLGKHAFTQLRRQGLSVSKVGNRVFIRGEDFMAFLAKQNATTPQ